MEQRIVDSPIGLLLICADESGIRRIHLTQNGEALPASQNCALLLQAERELGEYFAGRRRAFSFPLSMHGTAFEKQVWQALLKIPYGETCTYGQLAAQLGMPKSARAVGGACARNPLLIAVPCHRVIAGSGALTGFAAGMQAKGCLLSLEGHRITNNRIRA